jgi:hypothetical protein
MANKLPPRTIRSGRPTRTEGLSIDKEKYRAGYELAFGKKEFPKQSDEMAEELRKLRDGTKPTTEG